MLLAPIRSAAPTDPLVALADAKAHLVVQHDDDDDLIASYIEAAEHHLDGHAGILGRALITQTWSVSGSRLTDRIDLPLAPVQSIESITYFDAEGGAQEIVNSVYVLHTDAAGPYVKLRSGSSWPSLQARDDAFTITFVAGYGDRASVPGPLQTAAKMIVASLYDTRETHTNVTLTETPFSVDALVAPYRRISF